MPSPAATRDLVDRQVRRAIRSILDAKERDLDAHLPPEVADRFRKVVQDEIRDLGAVVTHIAESAAEGYELNELAQDVRAVRTRLEAEREPV